MNNITSYKKARRQDISHFKGGIHSPVLWSIISFLYDVREQNNIGYQISSIWKNEQSSILKSYTAVVYYIYNFSSYEHFRRLGYIPIKKWLSLACFRFKPISVQYKQYKTSDFKMKDFPISKSFWLQYPILISLYLSSQIKYRKS